MVKAVYPVYLTSEERETLSKQIKTGNHSAYEQKVAHVLLKLDRSTGQEPLKDGQIAEMFSISRKTVIRIKKRFSQEGLRGPLSVKYPKERPERRKIQGREEAYLTVLACGASLDGTKRWTLRLYVGREKTPSFKAENYPQITNGGEKRDERPQARFANGAIHRH